MPYKSAKKQREAMRKWRQKHPNYMRAYYRLAVKPINSRRKQAAQACEIEI